MIEIEHRLAERSLDGCLTQVRRLLEMSEEPRVDFWADRMEQELEDVWRSTGMITAPLSVGRRATICQVNVLVRTAGRMNALTPLLDSLRSSPAAVEFSRFSAYVQTSDAIPGYTLYGWILVSNGNAAPDEPDHCFNVAESADR